MRIAIAATAYFALVFAYRVAAVLAVAVAMEGRVGGAGEGTAWLWAVFGVLFMGGRGVALVLRARSAHWMVTGAVR